MKKKRIQKNLEVLQRLKRARNLKTRTQLLHDCDKNVIACIVETIFNLLQKEIPVTSRQEKSLLKQSKLLRKISKVRDENIARKIIVQKGAGIIPLLIGPIFAAVTSLISALVNKK